MDIYRDTSEFDFTTAGLYPTVVRKGEIYLFGDITEEMACEVVRKLNENKPEELAVFVSTNGGILGAGLAIYDALLKVKKTTVIVTGMCASTGTLILLSGTFRVATPNTQFVVHDVDMEPTPETTDEISRDLPYLNSVVDAIFERRLGEHYQEAKTKHIFGVKDAFKFRMIDRIDP